MSKRGYREIQKRKDDELLFEESLRNKTLPWITITHDGRDLLEGALKSVLKDIIPTQPIDSTPTEEDIRRILSENIDYSNAAVWNIDKDTDLIMFVLERVIQGSTHNQALKEYTEHTYLGFEGLKNRWKFLKSVRSKIQFTRRDTL